MAFFFLAFLFTFPAVGAGQGVPSSFSYPVPNESSFLGWDRRADEESSGVDLYAQERLSLTCARPGIFPTHPQMSLKRYHLMLTGRYDHFRLSGRDEACALAGKKPDGRGVIPCFRPDTLAYALFSDTYEDACGHRFRGVKRIAFFRRDETMGTLFSPGRGMWRKVDSGFEDYVPSATYALSSEDFLFLIPLFPGDEAAIKAGRRQALEAGFLFNERTGLFERR